jgi:hypothetical protein
MDLKHVFQRIRDFLNMHFKVYDIVNCKHYIQLLKAYKPMPLQKGICSRFIFLKRINISSSWEYFFILGPLIIIAI